MVAMFPTGQVSVKVKNLSLIKKIPIFTPNTVETRGFGRQFDQPHRMNRYSQVSCGTSTVSGRNPGRCAIHRMYLDVSGLAQRCVQEDICPLDTDHATWHSPGRW